VAGPLRPISRLRLLEASRSDPERIHPPDLEAARDRDGRHRILDARSRTSHRPPPLIWRIRDFRPSSLAALPLHGPEWGFDVSLAIEPMEEICRHGSAAVSGRSTQLVPIVFRRLADDGKLHIGGLHHKDTP